MKNYLLIVAILTLIMAACSPSSKKTNPTESAAATDTETPMEMPTDETANMTTDMEATGTEMPMEMPTDEATDMMADMEASNSATAYNGPDWATVELTNARTGETFTLADFAGKTVYVEPMATWCSNCMRQQRTVRDIVGNFSPDEYVFISLSVETNISGQQLADYADTNEFTWLFSVSTPELLQTLINVYGNTVSNPPSTPHFFLAPDGTASQLYSGYHDDAKLTEQLMG